MSRTAMPTEFSMRRERWELSLNQIRLISVRSWWPTAASGLGLIFESVQVLRETSALREKQAPAPIVQAGLAQARRFRNQSRKPPARRAWST